MSAAWRMWRSPASVGLASTAGLLGALLLEGPLAQVAGCLALAVPVAVVLVKIARSEG